MSTPPTLSLKPTRIALIQLGQTSFDKQANLDRAREAVLAAAAAAAAAPATPASPAQGKDASPAPHRKPDIIVLPECFNSPYGVQYFEQYAESLAGAYHRIKRPLPAALPRMPRGNEETRWSIDNHNDPASTTTTTDSKGDDNDDAKYAKQLSASSPTAKLLSDLARSTSTIIVGGSIPERDDATGKLYNTSCVFNEQGRLISLHRKLHLFDIDIRGKMTFQESKTLTGGDRITIFDCSRGRFGLGICYDLRFPEPAIVAARLGAGAVIYPGAFNTTTGPVSWELLQRCRATDNQVYVVGCSPARPSAAAMAGEEEEEGGWKRGEKAYPAWGHSTVVGPRGDVKASLDEGEDTLVFDLDPEEVEEVRKTIPISLQRRFDVYPDITCG